MTNAGLLTSATRPADGNSFGRSAVAGTGGVSWDDLRKKAHARLVERVDPVRNKHKPISILRQESRRTLEQFLEAEYPYVVKDDRGKLVDEVLGEAVGLGPLEELFRDETVLEILVLAPNQIIARRGVNWLPASVAFRDANHLRTILTRTLEQGESVLVGTDAKSAFDVKLPNGFRAIAVIPPAVMDLIPLVAFTRTTAITGSAVVATPNPRTAGVGNPMQSPLSGSHVFATPAPRGASAIVTTPGPRSGPNLTTGPRSGAGLLAGSVFANDSIGSSSGIMATPAPRNPVEAGPNSGIFGNDPYSKMRGRITQRLITKIAAAGVYDIQQIPKGEMQRIVSTMVEEANANDKLNLDATEASRMILEILTAMQV